MNFLSGYKTYITAAASIITEVALYANGQATLQEALAIVIPAILAVFIRNGINTVAK